MKEEMTEEKKEELEKECYELEKYNCEPITFFMAGYAKGFSEGEMKDEDVAKKLIENEALKRENEALVTLSQNRGAFIDWCCSKHPKIILQYLEE